MRFVIQRVSESSVTIDGQITAEIGEGFLVLIGITHDDTKETADKMIRKLLGLRIFEDENGKTNLSLSDVKGSLLLVSQFTLYADCKRGNRPGFTGAARPEVSEPLYEYILKECKEQFSGIVESGSFGADMKISLINNGPFTVVLDSFEL